jgi:phage terminase large subunit GpA-like protein
MIGTGSAQEAIYQRLALDTPGPGFCHFPTPRMVERDGIVSTLYNEAWFEQLTAEKQILEKKHGFSYHRWILPKGRANEALDCRVYAYAALAGLYATRKLSLDRVAQHIEDAHAAALEASGDAVTAGETKAAPEGPAVIDEVQQNKPKPAPRRAIVRRSAWMA